MAEAPFAPPPFVGRQTERDTYQLLLGAARDPWMLLISGQGGNGKSRLLQQLQEETPSDARVGLLDFANEYLRVETLQVAEALARLLRPLAGETSFQAFWQEYRTGRERLAQMSISLRQEVTVSADAQAQGISQSINTASAVNEMRRQVERLVTTALLDLAADVSNRRVVLLLDTCEWLHEPGSHEVGVWLKDTLPRLRAALNDGLRVVATGREGLERLFPFEGAASLRLGLLPFLELEIYLRQVGMQDAALHQAVFEMTRGHPLCTSIIAQVWRERPFGSADLPAFEGEFSDQAVTSWVLERVLKRLQPHYDDLTRYGVLLRSFDLPLLRAVFPEWLDADDQVFQRLTGYAFILRLANRRHAYHDLLRQVQAGYVRRQLPERWRQYHERAFQYWQQQREEVFGLPVKPPDYYYHRLALDEAAGMEEWEKAIEQATIIGERDYWGRLLQVAHDAALVPSARLRAKRTFYQGRFFYYQDQLDAAIAAFQQALGLFRQIGDRQGEADTLRGIGDVQRFREESDSAQESYRQAITLFRQVGDRRGEARCLRGIGEIQLYRDEYDAALKGLQQALALYRQVEDRQGEAMSLRNIGDVQRMQNDYDAALESYQQALALDQQVGSRLNEASTRQSIGIVQELRDEYDAALKSYQQALALNRQIGDRRSEAANLRNIGDVQRMRNDYDAALESYQQALDRSRQVDDHRGEAATLQSIGVVQYMQDDYDAALESYGQALAFYQQIDERLGQADIRQSIGAVLYRRNDYDAALESYQQALASYQQIGNHLGAANTLKGIGDVQRIRNDYDAALASYRQSLAFYQQVGSRLGEANALQGIGDVQRLQTNYDVALENYRQALALYHQIGDHRGKANTLKSIGATWSSREDYDAALTSYQQALAFYQEIGEQRGKAQTLQAIGEIQQARKDLSAALNNYEQARTLYRQIGDHLDEGTCALWQGAMALLQGSFQQALTLQTEAYQLFQQVQNTNNQALALYFRSFTYGVLQQQQLAIQDVETALPIAEQLKLPLADTLRQRLDELRG